MFNNKKGDIWVSAILYFGLGIVVITIILTAATPIVNKLRDKNIILQTKEVFQVLDSNIREVAREGPGAQRPLTIDIRKGEFKIDEANGQLVWSYPSKALIAEPGVDIVEGNVLIRTVDEGKTFPTSLTLIYQNLIYINYRSPVQTISGNAPLVMRNAGVTCGPPDQTEGTYRTPVAQPSGTDVCLCDLGTQTQTSQCVITPRPTVEIVQRTT